MRSRRIVAVVGVTLLLVAAGAAALLYATRRDVTTSSAEAARVYKEALDNERCAYLKEARLGFARAIELDPDFAEALLGLARQSGDGEQGMALVRRAAKLKDRLTERERLHVDMQLAARENRREDTVAIAERIHARYPDDVRAAMTMAGAELFKGNNEGAVKIFTDLLATSPNNPDAYNQIGYYYAYRGDTDRALENLKKYQFMLPESANPYDSLGEVLAYSGRYDEAIASLNQALKIKPDFFESWGHLGVAYEGKGEAGQGDRGLPQGLGALRYRRPAFRLPGVRAPGGALQQGKGSQSRRGHGRTSREAAKDRPFGDRPGRPACSARSDRREARGRRAPPDGSQAPLGGRGGEGDAAARLEAGLAGLEHAHGGGLARAGQRRRGAAASRNARHSPQPLARL